MLQHSTHMHRYVLCAIITNRNSYTIKFHTMKMGGQLNSSLTIALSFLPLRLPIVSGKNQAMRLATPGCRWHYYSTRSYKHIVMWFVSMHGVLHCVKSYYQVWETNQITMNH